MIAYVTLGTKDIKRAAEFYDALFAEIGATRMMDTERFVGWSTGPGKPAVCVVLPYDGNDASVGNGAMVAVGAGSKENVEKLHKKALELGGTDEGAPGPRGDGMFYCGYFRDLDGNKINAFCMG